MSGIWGDGLVSLVGLLALTAVVFAGGFYVIDKVRRQATEAEPPSSDWMAKFQELHAKGELSDQEYRTIKAVLTERFQGELKETGEPG